MIKIQLQWGPTFNEQFLLHFFSLVVSGSQCNYVQLIRSDTNKNNCIIVTSIAVYEDTVKKTRQSWTSSISTRAIPTRQEAAQKHRTTCRRWTDRRKRSHSSIIPNRPLKLKSDTWKCWKSRKNERLVVGLLFETHWYRLVHLLWFMCDKHGQ